MPGDLIVSSPNATKNLVMNIDYERFAVSSASDELPIATSVSDSIFAGHVGRVMRLATTLASFMLAFALVMTSHVAAQEAAPAKLSAPALFPEKTLAYIRVDNVKELKEAFSRSTTGRLAQDDQIRPILTEFYGSLVNSLESIREVTGLDLDQMLSIPTGELAVAVLPSDQTQTKVNRQEENQVRVEVSAPSVAVMMDAGEEITGVQVMLDRMRDEIQLQHTEDKLGSLTLHRFANPDKANEQFGYFIDQGVFIGCSNLTALDRLAKRWTGGAVDWPALSENRRFTSIMGRCVGTQGERPQVSFFVDPLALIRQLSPKSTSSSMVFAMLPALGLDDIQALGGSVIIAPPDFDSISHFHVLLGSPRRAIWRRCVLNQDRQHLRTGYQRLLPVSLRSTGMLPRRCKPLNSFTISSVVLMR